jgi:phosphotransferase system IIA component
LFVFSDFSQELKKITEHAINVSETNGFRIFIFITLKTIMDNQNVVRQRKFLTKDNLLLF